jgi:hypothetical protein
VAGGPLGSADGLRLSGGGHLVIGYSLGDLDSTVTRLEVSDALAAAVALIVLAGIGLPLVRASLAPLTRNRGNGGRDRGR